jgi:hypothetical protein
MADGSQTLSKPAKPLNSRQKRQLMEAALDRLLGAVEGVLADLDAIDGEADLEPSLGFLERPCGLASASGDQRAMAQGARDEREVECEDEGAACEDEGAITGDDEPWLNPCVGNGSYDFRDLEGESGERDGQGGRMVTDGERRAYWRPGVGGEQYDLTRGSSPKTLPARRSPHQNVSGYIPVRVLP